MAVVPISQGSSVGDVRPAPFVPQQVQFDPNAFGAGIGQAEQGLGKTVGAIGDEANKIATNMAIDNDTRAAKVSDTQHQKNVTDLGFVNLPGGPDGNKGYYSLQGQDAVTYRPAYEKALNDSNTAIADGLKDSPRAQNFYNNQAGMRVSAEVNRSAEYAMRQGIVADNNASGARLSAYKDSLTVNYNDPGALANFQAVTRGEVADTGRRMGWGTDQIAEATTKALSAGYRDAILARVTAGDIDGAAQMFKDLRPGMDAATSVSLAQHLQPLMTASAADALVKGLLGGAKPATGSASTIADAIHGQESGGKATSVNSIDGAVGGWQIMPATFAANALPGENINNPADNERVGRRLIDKYSTDYNGDAGRVATAYFSGPGNVAPAGSPTPYIKDTHDGNGKYVSSYVADINRRLGHASAKDAPTPEAPPGFAADGTPLPAGAWDASPVKTATVPPPGPPAGNASDANPAVHPDFAGVQQKVIDATADNPKLQAAALSRLHTAASQYELSTQADRDKIQKNWNDTVAAAAAGSDTVSIDEASIRHVYRPDIADYMIGQFHEAVVTGQVTKSLKLASPAQTNLVLGSLAADVKDEDPAHFVQRQKLLSAAQAAVSQRQKALSSDPAAYVMQNDPNVADAYKAVDPSKPETVQAAADASLSSQRALGVENPSILNAAQAGQMVKSLETTTANNADMGAQLNKLQDQYGPHYGAVVSDLTKAGLSPRYQMLAHANLPEQATVRSDAQAAFQAYDALGKDKSEWGAAIPVEQKKLLEPALDAALAPYRQTIGASAGGAGVLATTVYPAVKTTAQYYMLQGMPADAAVQKAAGLINKSYSFDDELRVPTAPGMPTTSQVRASMNTLTAGLTDADLRGTTAAEARYSGVWFTNGDDKGATLLKGTLQGGYLPVRRADGSPVSVDFKSLPTATSGVQAAVSQAQPAASQALGAVN